MSILNIRYDQYMRLFRELKSGRTSLEETSELRKILTDCGKELDRQIKIEIAHATLKGVKSNLVRANILSDGEALGGILVDVEHEKVKCPGMDFKLIERHECLDYSGANKFDECEGCETGAITKRLLLARAIEPVADKQPVI
jgi:hypothetical protein